MDALSMDWMVFPRGCSRICSTEHSVTTLSAIAMNWNMPAHPLQLPGFTILVQNSNTGWLTIFSAGLAYNGSQTVLFWREKNSQRTVTDTSSWHQEFPFKEPCKSVLTCGRKGAIYESLSSNGSFLEDLWGSGKNDKYLETEESGHCVHPLFLWVLDNYWLIDWLIVRAAPAA